MLIRMWQNIKFTSFLCRRKIYTSSHIFLCQVKNLYIKFITLLSVANYFSEKKKHIYRSSLLLWYQVFFYICIEYNFSLAFTTSINSRSGNYVLWNSTWPRLWISSSWRNFILSLFKQTNTCLELRDGDQAEFPSRRLEQYQQQGTANVRVIFLELQPGVRVTKSWIQDFGMTKSWIRYFGIPKSWIQDFGLTKSWIRYFGNQNPEFKILEDQNPEFKILDWQNPEFDILETKILNSRFSIDKILNSIFWKPKSRIQDFGRSKSWIQDFGLTKSWIRYFGNQNPEFMILEDQNPEFKILDWQNPEFDILETKIPNSRFCTAKILNSGFCTAKILNSRFWMAKRGPGADKTQDGGDGGWRRYAYEY